MLKNQTLRLRIYGIEYMNDDPSEVDVLYAKVQDLSQEPVVQELADGIIKYFAKTGLTFFIVPFLDVCMAVTNLNF